jgi:apolipoprotein N-acyltransferase
MPNFGACQSLWAKSAGLPTLMGMGTAQITARSSVPAPRTRDASVADKPATWWQSTLAVALFGQLLLWAAFPPLDWSLLAWLAPVPFVVLVRRATLAGRRPYAALWFSSFLFHLAVLYWVTLPHWATSIGWVALSFYLGLYFPLFIGLSRVAVHRLGISAIVAAPVVWTGLELARAHLLTGFGMAALAHTQYRWPEVLQISDTLGGYGVSFLIIFVAACLARIVPINRNPPAWWPVLPLAAALAAVLGYGHWRMGQQTTTPGPKVALVQGSIDIDMKYDPSESQRIVEQYYGLTRRALREHPDLDLIVWPETMFRDSWLVFDKDFVPPAGARWTAEEAEAASRRNVKQLVAPLAVPFLLGIDTLHYKREAMDRFNTALMTDRQGNVVGRYDKCHLVPFGEYVWLAETFPWLYKLTPLAGGAKAGAGPQSIELAGVRFAPNICYENTIGHLIRAQVSQLRAEGREPDVLVNLTNDGWFWGSSELDMHLACAVFRAIECRKPFLIAANTGFSASIDSNGRILAQGPRRATDLIVERPAIDSRHSPYLVVGDLPAGLCLLATCGLAVVGLVNWRRERKTRAAANR